FLAARKQYRIDAQFAPQLLHARFEIGLAFPAPDNLSQFGTIRRDHRRPDITHIVVTLWVDQDTPAGGTHEFDHARDVREPALAIVRQDDDVLRQQQRLVFVELLRQYLGFQ